MDRFLLNFAANLQLIYIYYQEINRVTKMSFDHKTQDGGGRHILMPPKSH